MSANYETEVTYQSTPPSLSQAMERLIHVVQRLSLCRDIESIVDIVRKEARLLTGADGATFVLRENEMCYYVDEDAIGPLWKGKRFPLETCISGWAMLNRKAVLIEDIYQDNRIPIDAYKPTFVKSLVMMPIRTHSPIGAIGNYWAKIHHPSDEEIKLLQALADSTSIAIENVQLYADLKQHLTLKTQQEEQYRLLSEQLQASLDEKGVLLKEVYHRVKNNLQIVTSLLNLQAEATGDLPVKSQLTESIKRVNAMAIVHEMLYQSENKANIKLKKYIDTLLDYLFKITRDNIKRIEFVIDVEDISISLDKAIPCGLIVNELISNSLKHAFPESRSGRVSLMIKQNGENVLMQVMDDGVGMKTHEVAVDGSKLGLSLIKSLSRQLNGKLSLESINGTRIEIVFPLMKA